MHCPVGPPSAPATPGSHSYPFGQSEATVHVLARASRDDRAIEARNESAQHAHRLADPIDMERTIYRHPPENGHHDDDVAPLPAGAPASSALGGS